MDSLSGHVMTLANSIIGVSILAMPYCFKECGIILSIVMLLISSIISRLACHFLLKSAFIARRKTFEFLAFHIFGGMGKFTIEIGIIGFLLGTCIAFFVVMGDLTPEILAEMTGISTTDTMRTSILMALALFAVLPLGLLRNVDSLNGVSRATIGFYCCLVLKVISEAIPHILAGDWYQNVNLWRSEGILQCLPIFSMALFCQTQLFEIYQALQNATVEKMNNLVREAVNICTCVYILVGIFGYIAFANKNFTGNILLSFSPSFLSDAMKIGFVISVIFSFPLVIFPCRASLHSLLYKEGYTSLHEGTANYIPEGKFKALTMFIVFVSLIIGIMIPNIELALGLIGSTIGVMICVLFPVTCFICISAKNTNERILAQIMLLVGLTVMVLGTYKNLYSLDQVQNMPVMVTPTKPEMVGDKIVDKINFANEMQTTLKMIEIKTEKALMKVTEEIKEVRHEPPQPVEPVDEDPKIKPAAVISEKVDKLLENQISSDRKLMNETKNEEVDIEAIKKEDKEEALQEKLIVKDDANKALLDTIQKQNEVQKVIVEQQKKLIEVIQNQQKNNEVEVVDKVNEEKLKAVKEIQNIALKAIEKISGNKEEKNSEKNDEPPSRKSENNIKISENILNIETDVKLPKTVGSDNKILKNLQKQVDQVVNNIIKDDPEKNTNNILTKEVLGDNSNGNKNKENDPLPKIDTNSNKNDNSMPKMANLNIPEAASTNIPSEVHSGTNHSGNASSHQSNMLVNADNNTAPLFLTLGKAENKINDTKPQVVQFPLSMGNSSIQAANKSVASPVPVENVMKNNKDTSNVLDVTMNGKEEVQAMRRDILSFSSG